MKFGKSWQCARYCSKVMNNENKIFRGDWFLLWRGKSQTLNVSIERRHQITTRWIMCSCCIFRFSTWQKGWNERVCLLYDLDLCWSRWLSSSYLLGSIGSSLSFSNLFLVQIPPISSYCSSPITAPKTAGALLERSPKVNTQLSKKGAILPCFLLVNAADLIVDFLAPSINWKRSPWLIFMGFGTSFVTCSSERSFLF